MTPDGVVLAETDRLIIRNWVEADRHLLYEINSDQEVLEYFAGGRDRAGCDLFFEKAHTSISKTAYGHYVLELKAGHQPIGLLALAQTSLAPYLANGTIEIGWQLAKRYWHKGLAAEAAMAALEHGFVKRELPEIVAFTVPQNTRSIAVMKRIGLIRDAGRDFEHPRVPDSHPHLKQHIVYAMTRQQWLRAANAWTAP